MIPLSPLAIARGSLGMTGGEVPSLMSFRAPSRAKSKGGATLAPALAAQLPSAGGNPGGADRGENPRGARLVCAEKSSYLALAN